MTREKQECVHERGDSSIFQAHFCIQHQHWGAQSNNPWTKICHASIDDDDIDDDDDDAIHVTWFTMKFALWYHVMYYYLPVVSSKCILDIGDASP